MEVKAITTNGVLACPNPKAQLETNHHAGIKHMKLYTASSKSKVCSWFAPIVPTLCLFLLFCLPALATTWWVSAGASGNGTQSSPFGTISAAVTAAAPGDTINVESGTYRESVLITKANLTLQNYNGERAIVSGMGNLAPSAGTVWTTYTGPTKAPAGTVYTATVGSSSSPWKVRDMYGNYSRDQICRVPGLEHPWATIQSVSGSGTSYTVTVPSLGISFPSIQSAFVDIYEKTHLNSYLMYYITGITDNGTTTTINITTDAAGGADITVGDTLAVCNHPSLITGAYDFAYQDLGNGQTQLYLEPGSSSNLNYTQASKLVYAIEVSGVSGVVINGLEITGATNFGIEAYETTNLLVENCLIHDNGFGESFGEPGVFIRDGTSATIRNCCIIQNYIGISDDQANGITVSNTEIGFDDNDGLDLSGGGNTNPVDIDHCYIHNHVALLHPDDLQFDGDSLGTHNITIDSNFFTVAGQGIQSADLDGVSVTNNIFCGTGARNIVINNYNNVTDWSLDNNTFSFSNGYSLSGADTGTFSEFSVLNSIFYHDLYTFSGQTASDYNFFWAGNTAGNPEDPVVVTNPPWKTYYVDPTGSELGLPALNPFEVHSNGGSTVFMNAPYFQAQVNSEVTKSTMTSVVLDVPTGGVSMIGRWNVGDVVEFDGDGVVHTITASTVTADSATITFTPSLPAVPSRFLIVWDWPAGTTNLALDLRPAAGSLALTGSSTGGQRGSTINTLNYEAGIFTGTTRSIPTIPTNVHYGESWNYPYNGIQ